MEGRRTRVVWGHCPPCRPELGIWNPPAEWREKKTAGRLDDIISKQFSTSPRPISIFQSVSSFYISTFCEEGGSFTHGVKYILSDVNQEAVNTVIRARGVLIDANGGEEYS